jgi:gas vesicle protein
MKQNLKYVGWALAGSAVGAAIALLTAPASGPETRRRLVRRVEDERDVLLRKGHRALEGASGYLQQRLAQGRRRLGQVVNR